MKIQPIKTKIFNEGENLISFIIKNIKKVKENSVIVITSKIVALSENRTVIIENENTREKYIKSESDFAIKTRYTWLTIKDGVVMASAGIDESNANGKLILLPKNSFLSASKIRKELQEKYKVKNLGIIITDSRILPLRAGVTGVALGYAGFSGVKDYTGKPDIFGRKFIMSLVDVADSLATSAVFTMGEGDERRPLAVITNASITFCEKINKKELHIDIRDDMYQPLFTNLKYIK